MWQQCPICKGTGIDPNPGISNTPFPKCPTCDGQRIISELNGKPPLSNAGFDKVDLENTNINLYEGFCKALANSPNEPCFYPYCDCKENI